MAGALEAKRQAAGAKLEQMRAMEGAAGKKLDAADSMREQSRAAAHTAKVVRDYVVIEAPSSGYVVKRLVAPGVLVQPGMALKIAQIDRVWLQANADGKDLGSIRVGSTVTATPVGANQPPLTVKVTSVFPFVDQGPRTAVVEAIVDNGARRLLPGQYVLMQFSTGDRGDAVTVPRSAVARMGSMSTAWVVKDDRAEPRTALKTAKSKLGRAVQAEGLVRQQIAKDVNQAALMLAAADKGVEASRTGVGQAEEDFRVVRERFESGRGIQLEILDAQVALTRARFNVVNALAEHHNALAMWLRATGRTR